MARLRLPNSSHTVAVLGINNHAVTERCVSRVRASGFMDPVILVDNGSRPSYADIADRYRCRHVRNERNRFVNPAWNQVFRMCRTKYLTLLNNDCLIRDGYLNDVVEIMRQHGLALAVPSAQDVADIVSFTGDVSAESAWPYVDFDARREGFVMTIDMNCYRECHVTIPRALRVWFGDDWIWGQLRFHGFRCGRIENRTYVRETSRTVNELRANPRFDRILMRECRIAYNNRLMTHLRMHAGTVPREALSVWDAPRGLTGVMKRALRPATDWFRLSF